MDLDLTNAVIAASIAFDEVERDPEAGMTSKTIYYSELGKALWAWAAHHNTRQPS